MCIVLGIIAVYCIVSIAKNIEKLTKLVSKINPNWFPSVKTADLGSTRDGWPGSNRTIFFTSKVSLSIS